MTTERALYHYNTATGTFHTMADLDEDVFMYVLKAVNSILRAAELTEAQGGKLLSRQAIALAILISEN